MKLSSASVGFLRHSATTLVAAVLIAALSACAPVKLVSDYDEQTDKAVTALQKKVATFLIGLGDEVGTPACTYENNKAFYADAKVDVSALHVRVDALQQNQITGQQIALLTSSLADLESLHALKVKKPKGKNCLSKDEIDPLQNAFNTSFTAILKFELAKKRGEQ